MFLDCIREIRILRICTIANGGKKSQRMYNRYDREKQVEERPVPRYLPHRGKISQILCHSNNLPDTVVDNYQAVKLFCDADRRAEDINCDNADNPLENNLSNNVAAEAYFNNW